LLNLTQQLLQGARSLPNGSQLLHFTPTAQQAFNSWFVQNEKMLATGGLDPARQSHFAKYRSLIPALALLFHLLDGHAGPVCEDCLNRAVAFALYLKNTLIGFTLRFLVTITRLFRYWLSVFLTAICAMDLLVGPSRLKVGQDWLLKIKLKQQLTLWLNTPG
jgi:hypothetical protein